MQIAMPHTYLIYHRAKEVQREPRNHRSRCKITQAQGITHCCWDPSLGMATWVGTISRDCRGMTWGKGGWERPWRCHPPTVRLWVCNWAPPLGLACTSVESNRLEKCLSIFTQRRRLEGDQELKVIRLSYIVNFSTVWGLRFIRPCLKTHSHVHMCTHTHSSWLR